MTTRSTNAAAGAMRGVSQLQVVTTSEPSVSGPATASGKLRPSGRSSAAREAGSTYEQALNPREMANAWAARKHPYVRMCLSELTKRLFAGDGIVALQGEELRRPSPAFRTYLKRDMTTFAVDALHAILAFGVVPIAFRRPQTAGLGEYELAPYVPRYGCYTITTWADAGIQRFGFYWATQGYAAAAGWGARAWSTAAGPHGVYDSSVLVAHDFGVDPDVVTGELASNLYTISQHLRMAGELGDLAMTAERIASNPPLISQYDSRVEDRAEKDFGESFFVGVPDRCQDRADATYERSAARRQDLARELERWEQMTGSSARAEFGTAANVLTAAQRRSAGAVDAPEGARGYTGAAMPWANQYRVGVTEQLVQHQLPRPRDDFVAIQSQIMDIVCGVLNVPRGLLVADSSVRAGVEQVAEAMHRTTHTYASMLGSLLTGVYNHIFGHSDLRDELRIRIERRRSSPLQRAPQLLTEADLFEIADKTRVRIAFDLPPMATSESLQYLHDRGIISWTTFGTSMLRLSGFNHEQLASPTDPLSKRDRRVLLLGNNADPPVVGESGKSGGGAGKGGGGEKGGGTGDKESSSASGKKRKTGGDDVQSAARQTREGAMKEARSNEEGSSAKKQKNE